MNLCWRELRSLFVREARLFPPSSPTRFPIRGRLLLACSLLLAVTVAAQQAPSSRKPAGTAQSPWTRACVEGGGFCFEYPARWNNLGLVFGGTGTVVAEPVAGRPQSEWNQITAAAMETPESGGKPLELDELINRVLVPPPGAVVQTKQRRNTTVGGFPAQVVTTEVREENKPPVAELAAFIDADDVIYSLALRCAPSELTRLQPVFEHALRSWRERPAAK